MEMLAQLHAGIDTILPAGGLEQKLQTAAKENRPLVIKLGFDPTAPDLHLGHAVVLKKLKQFQQAGHSIVIIVGSFTAQIGDPTGKNKSRQPLSKEAVMQNAETYIRQLGKIMDVEKCRIAFNADWLNGLDFADILQLLARVTVAQLLHRNDFNKRFTENTPIAMHELMYPILQGFDSVHIKADIEMGGTDQLFNCTMGRQLQEAHGQEPQIVLCMPLLKGLDGKEKMSKSLNNTIGLTDTPDDMFGKTMSIPDTLIPEYLEMVTDFTAEEKHALLQQAKSGNNPMQLKKAIAKNIILQYHTATAAEAAENFFINQFQRRHFEDMHFEPVTVTSLHLPANEAMLIDLCHQLKQDETRTAIRRLITGGGVLINNEKITDPAKLISLTAGTRIRLGKRIFRQLQ